MFRAIGLAVFFLDVAATLSAAELKTLPGHVPPQSKLLLAKGDFPVSSDLPLALGVPLRDAAGLEKFLQSVTDPRSPNFRQYLSPEEFTERFGPTKSDYDAVKNFARMNGLHVTGEHGNRLVLDVSGPAANVQRAFQIKLQRFNHPTEAREFFAPDREPTVEATLPVADVSGLNNFKRPHSKLLPAKKVLSRAVARSGSAPNGDFMGNDFRNAYVPDTTLTGAGQIVGLLQFDSFYPGDIADYQAAAGLPNIPVQTVLIDGYDGTPSWGNGEVALDIELAMSMAPGLSKVVCFSAGIDGFQNDILSAMVSSNQIKQFSCSWGWGGGPNTTTDNLFRQMAAQGQSFFNASGDTDAFTPGLNSVNSVDSPRIVNAPSSSPYITQVGGTYLNTDENGAWNSETVWSWHDGVNGSSGGISDVYGIPSWQVATNMTHAKGSAIRRNIPDVAMAADNIYYRHDNGQAGSVSGTSCSAPLWAGFTALMNQQAAAFGKPPVGLVNAAIYALGNSSNYPAAFHDVTVGDNTSTASPRAFFATNGYDLCTGWGTPAGQKLIDALVGLPETLLIESDSDFTAFGAKTGAITPFPATITLVNNGDFPVIWMLQNSNVVNWLKVRPFKGTLATGETAELTVSYTAYTTNLPVGTFLANYKFTNLTAHSAQTVPFKFQMLPAMSVTATQGFTANGAVGGPFDVSTQEFTVLNRSSISNRWRAVRFANWLDVSPTNSGAVDANFGTAAFTVALNTNANRLPIGAFTTPVYVYNKYNQIVQVIPFTVRVGQNIISNGGFETGDFRGWSLDASSTLVTNRAGYIHGGYRTALLGQQTSPGYLAQTIPTLAGQTYQLSLWLANPKNPRGTNGVSPNEFSVFWEGVPIYGRSDIPTTNWFNLQFTVTATGNGSLLEFGFRDDPFYLALDDVTMKPVPPPKVIALAQKLVAAPPGKNDFAFHFTFAVTAGFNYQIQCQTNLAQPSWTDLGAPITATNDILNFSDTNTANYPQKFYRLKLTP